MSPWAVYAAFPRGVRVPHEAALVGLMLAELHGMPASGKSENWTIQTYSPDPMVMRILSLRASDCGELVRQHGGYALRQRVGDDLVLGEWMHRFSDFIRKCKTDAFVL